MKGTRPEGSRAGRRIAACQGSPAPRGTDDVEDRDRVSWLPSVRSAPSRTGVTQWLPHAGVRRAILGDSGGPAPDSHRLPLFRDQWMKFWARTVPDRSRPAGTVPPATDAGNSGGNPGLTRSGVGDDGAAGPLSRSGSGRRSGGRARARRPGRRTYPSTVFAHRTAAVSPSPRRRPGAPCRDRSTHASPKPRRPPAPSRPAARAARAAVALPAAAQAGPATPTIQVNDAHRPPQRRRGRRCAARATPRRATPASPAAATTPGESPVDCVAAALHELDRRDHSPARLRPTDPDDLTIDGSSGDPMQSLGRKARQRRQRDARPGRRVRPGTCGSTTPTSTSATGTCRTSARRCTTARPPSCRPAGSRIPRRELYALPTTPLPPRSRRCRGAVGRRPGAGHRGRATSRHWGSESDGDRTTTGGSRVSSTAAS